MQRFLAQKKYSVMVRPDFITKLILFEGYLLNDNILNELSSVLKMFIIIINMDI